MADDWQQRIRQNRNRERFADTRQRASESYRQREKVAEREAFEKLLKFREELFWSSQTEQLLSDWGQWHWWTRSGQRLFREEQRRSQEEGRQPRQPRPNARSAYDGFTNPVENLEHRVNCERHGTVDLLYLLRVIAERQRSWDPSDSRSPARELAPANLCDTCRQLPVCSPERPRGRRSAEKPEGLCDLCSALLYPLAASHSVNPRKRLSSRARGLTAVPKLGSHLYFRLLRGWLSTCDTIHGHNIKFMALSMPARMLDVGIPDDPDRVCLYTASRDGPSGAYVALSHRWQPEESSFMTLKSNLNRRSDDGMRVGSLPRKFQDAITVTRMLGIQYLWIDSLCIVQDDADDKMREISRMKHIFEHAYCALAATSAAGAGKGFLAREAELPLTLPGGAQDNPAICASSVHEDFFDDVERSELNSRGWVLQERALSARTIHFTASQTYWECESRVACESSHELPREEGGNTQLGSSQFPLSATVSLSEDRGVPSSPTIYEDCFTAYSKLSLSFSTDRPLAISALERRLSNFYVHEFAYGISEVHLCRSLLWHRPSRKHWMQRIADPRLGLGAHGVPSWSWMAYRGEISYRLVPPGHVNWAGQDEVRFTFGRFGRWDEYWLALQVSRVGQFSGGCYLEMPLPEGVMILNSKAEAVGTISLDEKPEGREEVPGGEDNQKEQEDPLEDMGCVVLGQWYGTSSRVVRESLLFVLLVRRVYIADSCDMYMTYRRIGIANVGEEYVSFPNRTNVWII